MLEFIKEENVWDTLKSSDKPLILYGMGLGAEKIMSELEQRGMKADDIFASDEFVRGHSFKGYKVLKYSEVCEKYKDFNVVLCFASRKQSLLQTHLPCPLRKSQQQQEDLTRLSECTSLTRFLQ